MGLTKVRGRAERPGALPGAGSRGYLGAIGARRIVSEDCVAALDNLTFSEGELAGLIALGIEPNLWAVGRTGRRGWLTRVSDLLPKRWRRWKNAGRGHPGWREKRADLAAF